MPPAIESCSEAQFLKRWGMPLVFELGVRFIPVVGALALFVTLARGNGLCSTNALRWPLPMGCAGRCQCARGNDRVLYPPQTSIYSANSRLAL